MPEYSEQELLLKIAGGDEYAFRKLFFLYHRKLATHIYRLTDSPEMAEEIVQDVFLKIWMSREVLAGVRNFKAYLFIISKNHCLNCIRKLTTQRIHMKECEDELLRQQESDNDESRIYHTLLDEAIDRLPAQQQKVYILSRHERLRYTEVADRLNISRESVKKYLQIATASITAYIQTNFETAVFLCFVLLFF